MEPKNYKHFTIIRLVTFVKMADFIEILFLCHGWLAKQKYIEFDKMPTLECIRLQ